MRPIVKICGLTRADDVRMCVRHGADIIGVVVDYPRPVPWNLSVQAATELAKSVPAPAKICVVTGGQADKILGIALETKADYIQLHCGETLEDTAYIASMLRKHSIKVIKALFPDMPDLEQAAERFSAAGVYALLLDPRTPDNVISAGAANFSVYEKIRRVASCPVILAGGITHVNVKEAITQTGAPAIDLMTSVERSPGVKDEAKVRALFQELLTLSSISR